MVSGTNQTLPARTIITLAVSALCLLAPSSGAFAQGIDEQLAALPEAKRKEFTDAIILGKKLYEQGEYEVALRQLDKAYGILPLPELLYRRGLALEKMGRYEDAIESLSAYLEQDTDAPSSRRSEIERTLERLRERVEDAQRAFVQITTAPEQVMVFVNEESTAKALTPKKLEISNDQPTMVRLVKPGYVSQEHTLEGNPGETLVLSVTLEPELEESEPPATKNPPSPLVLGIGAGAGALTVTSGVFFGAYMLNESEIEELSDKSMTRPTNYNAMIYAQNRRARRGWASLGGAIALGASALTLHHFVKQESDVSLSIRGNGIRVQF